jgi:hypothetical protein
MKQFNRPYFPLYNLFEETPIHFKSEFDRAETGQNLNIALSDMDRAGKALEIEGFSGLDATEKSTTYITTVAERFALADDNPEKVSFPDYFPKRKYIIARELLRAGATVIPLADQEPKKMEDRLLNAVLHRGCMHDDITVKGAYYDPTSPNIVRGEAVLVDTRVQSVSSTLYRMKNICARE